LKHESNKQKNRKDFFRLADEDIGGAAFDAGVAAQLTRTLLVRRRKTI